MQILCDCVMITSVPGLQLFFHEFFLGGKLAELDLGHGVILTDGADHFRLLLMAVLSLNVDPRNFPTGDSGAIKTIRF